MLEHSKGKRVSQRFSLSNTINSLTSEPNRRTSNLDRRSSGQEKREARRISNPVFNNSETNKRSSIDPRDSIQDLTEEERLALFRVGRRRRPTEFQLFSDKDHESEEEFDEAEDSFSDQNDKYKFDKEASIKRILGLSIQTKYTSQVLVRNFWESIWELTTDMFFVKNSTLHKGDRRNSNRRKQSLIESMLDPLALFQVPTEIKEKQNPKQHSVDINLLLILLVGVLITWGTAACMMMS